MGQRTSLMSSSHSTSSVAVSGGESPSTSRRSRIPKRRRTRIISPDSSSSSEADSAQTRHPLSDIDTDTDSSDNEDQDQIPTDVEVSSNNSSSAIVVTDVNSSSSDDDLRIVFSSAESQSGGEGRNASSRASITTEEEGFGNPNTTRSRNSSSMSSQEGVRRSTRVRRLRVPGRNSFRAAVEHVDVPSSSSEEEGEAPPRSQPRPSASQPAGAIQLPGFISATAAMEIQRRAERNVSVNMRRVAVPVATRGRGGRVGRPSRASLSQPSPVRRAAGAATPRLMIPTPPRRREDTPRLPNRPAPSPRAGPARGGMAQGFDLNQSMMEGFECAVCLENLASPTTILEENEAANDAGNAADLMNAAMQGIQVNVGADGQVVIVPPAPAVPARRGGAAGRGRATARVSLRDINPREIAATNCGHIYHKYCIEKWFSDQHGRKTCPACRKNTGKLLKLFPSNTQNIGGPPARPVNVDIGAALAAGGQVAGAVGGGAAAPVGRNVNLQPGQLPTTGCQNVDCVYICNVYQTLMADHNAVREDLNKLRDDNVQLRDDLALRNAENASLQEGFDRANEQIEELKAAEGSGTKRRRQH